MFIEHKITFEKGENVLYLYTQPFDVNTDIVKGIFEHLHEDVLWDWTKDYLDENNLLFRGKQIKIVTEKFIVRELEFPKHLRKLTRPSKRKIITLKQKGR